MARVRQLLVVALLVSITAKEVSARHHRWRNTKKRCLGPSVHDMLRAARELRECRKELQGHGAEFRPPRFINFDPACIKGYAEHVERLEDNAFACQQQLFAAFFRKDLRHSA